ncbi:MAG: hypothetical protein A3J06_03710 [Candidatus Moranbacteria bacterium RIFCSPLOWO2_02_FULL_48_19]|nr:MAG: hypothetical protein A3J06_03710 [Candidatus Moranbacteria bacterium RIFCSPLOWO2_02_FULL_48_19]
MNLQTYKKLKQETGEAIVAFGESSLSELAALEREAAVLEKEFVTELEGIKAEELLKKINGAPASE